jgi:D-alanyl-D-alanine carboxypeptidase
MADLWNAYGFRWGGDYPTSKDWMHFEFMGMPEDARELTEKARVELAKEVEQLTPEQEKAIERMTTFLDTLTTKLGRVGDDTGEGERERGASPKGAANRVATVVLKAERG